MGFAPVDTPARATAPPCCRAGRGSWWVVTDIAIRPDHLAEVEPVALEVARRYERKQVASTRFIARGETQLSVVRAGFVAELIVAEVLHERWNRGDPRLPDVGDDIEVRFTRTLPGPVIVDRDTKHLERRWIHATPSSRGRGWVAIHAWAFGWEVREHGAWAPHLHDPGYVLSAALAHLLPFHKPKPRDT